MSTTFPSEQGQLRFETKDVSAGPLEDIAPGRSPVLEGTTLCATVCLADGGAPCQEPSIAAADACFAASVQGPATLVDDCVTFDSAGAVRWAFEPRECDGHEGLVADGVDFQVVAAAQVTAERDFSLERLVAEGIAASPDENDVVWSTTEPDGGMPDDYAPAAGEPMLFLEGGAVSVEGRLLSEGVPVIWGAAGEAGPQISAREGEPPVVVSRGNASVTVAIDGAGAGNLDFRTGPDTWALGTWETVPPRSASELELVAVYAAFEGQIAPMGARAIVRDDAGRPIFGAPVEWGVADGSLGVSTAEEGLGDRSYATLDGSGCIRPSERVGPQQARLQARLGRLVDEVELSWELTSLGYTDAELAQMDAEFEPGDLCLAPVGPAGCGCAAGAPSRASAAFLLPALAIARRRRARSACDLG